MVKVGIGRRTVLTSGTLIMSDGESARIDIPLPLWAPIASDVVKLELRFTEPSRKETDVKWVTENGIVKFEFHGWNNSLGTALKTATPFGMQDGRALLLHIAHWLIVEANVVHYQVMQEDATP